MRFIAIITRIENKYVNIEASDESKAEEVLEDYIDELNRNSKLNEFYEKVDLITEKELKYMTASQNEKVAEAEWLREEEE